MSNWNNKSVQNINAATLLLNNDMANESVHCSYYSCVQFVFHVFNSAWGMDVGEVEANSHSEVNNLGTHKWLRKQIYNSLKNKNKKVAKRFYDSMAEMSTVRSSADYNHDDVGHKAAEAVNFKAKDIIQTLQEYYEV